MCTYRQQYDAAVCMYDTSKFPGNFPTENFAVQRKSARHARVYRSSARLHTYDVGPSKTIKFRVLLFILWPFRAGVFLFRREEGDGVASHKKQVNTDNTPVFLPTRTSSLFCQFLFYDSVFFLFFCVSLLCTFLGNLDLIPGII